MIKKILFYIIIFSLLCASVYASTNIGASQQGGMDIGASQTPVSAPVVTVNTGQIIMTIFF